MHRIRKYIPLFALACVLLACGDDVVADGDAIVYLTPFESGPAEAKLVEDSPPTIDPTQRAEYEEVIDSVTARASELMRRPDVTDVLGSIEQNFLLSGRYLELVAIYQQQYAVDGTTTAAAPALGWSYLQIGNEPGAKAVKDSLVEERPQDPLTWLVVGEYHFRHAETSLASARRSKEAYERLLELDPEFSAYMSLQRSLVENKIDALRRRVPDTPVDQQPAATDEESSEGDQPMHHTQDD